MNVDIIIKNCACRLTGNVAKAPWSILDHGRAVLQTDEQLDAYIAAYGEMHMVKCRCALQNFPFQSIGDFEVIDWGCGQGLATLTLIQMLEERGILYKLKKVTLVEPSQKALSRAVEFISPFLRQIQIQIVNKYIPFSREDDQLSEITFASTPTTIHLLSNILDLHCINLQWLSEKVARTAAENFVICVGPKISGNSRIQDFCGYFAPTSYFSDVSQFPYAYTRNSHPFGCETKCFRHLRITGINAQNIESSGNTEFTDDYSYAAEGLRGTISDSIIDAYNVLRSRLSDGDLIFFRPNISTDIPDIMIIRKGKGILLVNVYDIKPGNNLNNQEAIEAECARLEGYHHNLVYEHIPGLSSKVIADKRYYGLVKEALYVPFDLSAELTENLAINHKYVHILNDKKASEWAELVGLSYGKSLFDDSLYSYAVRLVTSGWHPYSKGEQGLRLTKKQAELSISKPISQKIQGCAGSGKTQILACRAVNAQVRTGGRVLILTYNITLVNYIRYRILQVPADFSWSNISVTSYYQFIRSQAFNCGRKLSIADYSDPNIFDSIADNISKFDAIFIDEGQDYQDLWFRILKDIFLKDGGEFVIFADGNQNLYQRPQDKDRLPITPISGAWNKINEESSISFRVFNPNLLYLADDFKTRFIDSMAEPTKTQLDLFATGYVKYFKVSPYASSEEISDIVEKILKYDIVGKSVVMLSQSRNILRNISHIYTTRTGNEYKSTFMNYEDFEIIKKRHKGAMLERVVNDEERVIKSHFLLSNEKLNFSTIHSFKGWEANTVILLIQPDGDPKYNSHAVPSKFRSPSVIYTGLTRAKTNLFIINMGDSLYHEFFMKTIGK